MVTHGRPLSLAAVEVRAAAFFSPSTAKRTDSPSPLVGEGKGRGAPIEAVPGRFMARARV